MSDEALNLPNPYPLMPLEEFEGLPQQSQHELLKLFPHTTIDLKNRICAVLDDNADAE